MEIVEFIFAILFDVFGGFLAELVGEVFFRKVDTNPSRSKSTISSILMCFFTALFLGGLSLSLSRAHFINNPDLRLLSLIVSPLLIGLLMGLRGKLLRRKGKIAIKLDSFAYGWLFAFVFLGMRYFFGRT